MTRMTLKVGDTAPDFSTTSDDGRTVSLSALRGRWVVLFFYPRAGSAGCSIEAQRFEGALPEFERLGATVIGVSSDTEAAQAKFRLTCRLSYPLLPDGDRSLCRAYGVAGGLPSLFGMTARATYLIDPEGRIAWRLRQPNPLTHASSVLTELERLQTKGSGRRDEPPAASA
jgi:peroxiredoxin Q/BCP